VESLKNLKLGVQRKGFALCFQLFRMKCICILAQVQGEKIAQNVAQPFFCQN
jgi:hypothetical protein